MIVISDNAQELPASLSVAGSSGPTVAMRTNPSDPYSKVLLLTGGNPDELVTAARALTLMKDSGQLSGDVQRLSITSAPAKSEPDEAPRWMRTDKNTPIGDISQQGDLQGDGSVPVGIYMRVPPDLYYGAKQNLAFQLYYRYNGIPLANESSLQVYMNQAYISSTPMPHTEKASANLSTIVPVPVVDMRPFSNTMLMKFIFQIAKKGHCQDTAPLNLQARSSRILSLIFVAFRTGPRCRTWRSSRTPATRLRAVLIFQTALSLCLRRRSQKRSNCTSRSWATLARRPVTRC